MKRSLECTSDLETMEIGSFVRVGGLIARSRLGPVEFEWVEEFSARQTNVFFGNVKGILTFITSGNRNSIRYTSCPLSKMEVKNGIVYFGEYKQGYPRKNSEDYQRAKNLLQNTQMWRKIQ